MGAFDFFTTGRENLQDIGGKVVGGMAKGGAQFARQNPVPTVLSLGTAPFWAGLARTAGNFAPGGGGGGGGGGGDPSQPQQPATPQQQQQQQQAGGPQVNQANAGFNPYINPLAMSAFFSNSIAPYLNSIADRYAQQSGQAMNLAQQNLNKFQMPAQFKAAFGQMLPQMQQDQAGVMASLQQAAATQPQYEAMMQGLGNLQKQAQQAYATELSRKAYEQTYGVQPGSGPQGSQIAGATNPAAGL